MPTSAPPGSVLLAVAPLLLLGACSNGSTESDTPPPALSSAAVASPSEAVEPAGDSVPALIGTWDYEFDRAERRVILKDFAALVDDADRIVVRLAFVDENEWWLGFLFDGKLFLLDGVPEGDGGRTRSTQAGSAL